MNKKDLSETDIRSKFITPALVRSGWDLNTQIREEVALTAGKVIVKGKAHSRGKIRFADYVLSWKLNLPLAILEAKDNNHSVGDGMQQALHNADMHGGLPFAFSSNGDGFLFHDRTAPGGVRETFVPHDAFPTPEDLWQKYCAWKGLDSPAQQIVAQDYYLDADGPGGGKAPRYYQLNAINATVEAIARGQRRILLVMATGTGKTYTAFQIIWRLWKSGAAKRILFLVDRNILADQAKTNDFKPFGQALTKIQNRQADKSYEVYLALYQAVSGTDEAKNIYRQFSPDFFDLVVIDECHRGSAREDAAWHGILDYFTSAVHIGLTATPKETADVSNSHYFGDPVYTYSLRQGIEDGFLAPYKVIRVDLDKDLFGWRPAQGKTDKHGELIEDRIYNQRDMDRTLVLEQRTNLVARRTTEFLESNDRFAKTIVFCEDIDHAERMRQALVNQNGDLVAVNRKYVMRITGDEHEGKAELDNFIDPESSHPDYTRRNLRQTYASLDDFLATWSAAGKKKAIVEALEEQGVLWEPLAEEVGKDLDPFDLICHVAFGQPPLTRRERAERVRKRDVFTKYGDQARLVIDALLDKYADQGIEDLESTAVLKVPPFDRFGTPIEIVRLFGGRVGFEAALSDLKQTLYTE